MHRLDFGCSISLLDTNIAKIIVDEGVEMDLDMVEEFEDYLASLFTGPFALLVDKRNHYGYTYEAQLCLASLENLTAIAVLYYDLNRENIPPQFNQLRRVDQINIKLFPATTRGSNTALSWLKRALESAKPHNNSGKLSYG